jgi:hypothetical protein
MTVEDFLLYGYDVFVQRDWRTGYMSDIGDGKSYLPLKNAPLDGAFFLSFLHSDRSFLIKGKGDRF